MRSAAGWREFWRERGEAELRMLLREAWPVAREGDETRVATLLGSRAPAAALEAELGRMRAAHGLEPNAVEDGSAAVAIVAWFARASS
ncbi:MAG: hypothetical protein ACR2MU_00230 [Gaiellaceae bacterium]